MKKNMNKFFYSAMINKNAFDANEIFLLRESLFRAKVFNVIENENVLYGVNFYERTFEMNFKILVS